MAETMAAGPLREEDLVGRLDGRSTEDGQRGVIPSDAENRGMGSPMRDAGPAARHPFASPTIV